MSEGIIAVWVIAGSAIVFLFYKTSDGFNVAIRSLFGAKKIRIKGTSSAIDGEVWAAILERDPWGEAFAWRYPANRIGKVTLNEDGTGEYCGSVKWRLG